MATVSHVGRLLLDAHCYTLKSLFGFYVYSVGLYQSLWLSFLFYGDCSVRDYMTC